MVKYLKEMVSNKLIQGSAVLFVSSFVVSIGNYAFQLVMGRMLGPEDYSIVASLSSVFLIYSIFGGTLQIAVVRYVSTYKAQGNYEKLSKVVQFLNSKLLLLGLVIFIVLLLTSRLLADFLKIDSVWPVLILDGVFLVVFVVSLNRAVLQGLQRFVAYSINIVLEVAAKLGLGVLLVILGFSVNGAVGGITLGLVLAYLLSVFQVRIIKKIKGELAHNQSSGEANSDNDVRFKKSNLKFFTLILASSICLTLFFTIDVVLVKHFFSAQQAGFYGALSNLGKIIVFGTAAIANVLLPLAAEKHEKKGSHQYLFIQSLLLTALASVVIIVIYFIIPNFVVKAFYGEEYLPIVQYLGMMGVVMSLYSLINIIITYLISIKNLRYIPILLLGIITEIVLICFLHNSINQIIISLLAVLSVTLVSLLVFYKMSVNKAKSPNYNS